MAVFPTLPLKAIRETEPFRSWSEVTSPQDLILYIVNNFVVDPNALSAFQQIFFSSSPPVGEDAGKPWFKTSTPAGVGVPVGENYIVIYQYPPNVPLIWTKPESEFPAYLRKMDTSEVEDDYKLVVPTKGFYFMFEP